MNITFAVYSVGWTKSSPAHDANVRQTPPDRFSLFYCVFVVWSTYTRRGGSVYIYVEAYTKYIVYIARLLIYIHGTDVIRNLGVTLNLCIL